MTTLELDKYAYIGSPLQRWDARWKLVAGGLFCFSAAMVQHVGPAAVATGLAVLLVLAARLPVTGILHRLRGIGVVIGVVVVVLAATGAGERVDVVGVPLSRSGLALGGRMALRASAIMLVLVTVTATSRTQHTLAALQSLRVPASLVQIVHLTYRYLFVLQSESHNIRQAMRARGFRFRLNGRSLTTLGNAVGMLMIRSIERADRVYLAMQARGFDGTFNYVSHGRTTAGDVVKFSILTTAAILLVIWDCRLGNV